MKLKNSLIISLLFIALYAVGCTKSDDDELSQNSCDELGISRPADELTESDFDPRIVNGGRCDESDSPVAQLTILFSDGSTAVCSGALVSSHSVLTAGHCFIPEGVDTTEEDDKDVDAEDDSAAEEASFKQVKDDVKLTSVSVRVGGIDVGVNGFVLHPNFVSTGKGELQNDVAIANLSSQVGIRPLPIVVTQPVKPGDFMSVYGYGLDEDGNVGALNSGEMEIFGINSQTIDARFQDEGVGVCFGDSGGPALLKTGNGTGIVGVASFIGGGSSKKKLCKEGNSASFVNVQAGSIIDFLRSSVAGLKTI